MNNTSDILYDPDDYENQQGFYMGIELSNERTILEFIDEYSDNYGYRLHA